MDDLNRGEGSLEEPAAEPRQTGPDASGRLRRPSGETVGTGSLLGLGCGLVVVVLVLILAALFFLPFVR